MVYGSTTTATATTSSRMVGGGGGSASSRGVPSGDGNGEIAGAVVSVSVPVHATALDHQRARDIAALPSLSKNTQRFMESFLSNYDVCQFLSLASISSSASSSSLSSSSSSSSTSIAGHPKPVTESQSHSSSSGAAVSCQSPRCTMTERQAKLELQSFRNLINSQLDILLTLPTMLQATASGKGNGRDAIASIPSLRRVAETFAAIATASSPSSLASSSSATTADDDMVLLPTHYRCVDLWSMFSLFCGSLAALQVRISRLVCWLVD